MCLRSGRRSRVVEPSPPAEGNASSVPPERFSRLMSITEADWLRSLPDAVGPSALTVGAGSARVTLPADGGAGHHHSIRMAWTPADDLVLAGIRLKRLQVTFDLTGVPPAIRADFMRRFDLHMQRGGG